MEQFIRMATFTVNESFQFRGRFHRVGGSITATEAEVKDEIKKGEHFETKKPLSGLLNHCSPVDEFTFNLCKGVKGIQEPEKEKSAEEIKKEEDAIRAEFKELGLACNPQWNLKRLQTELKRAKKEKGL